MVLMEIIGVRIEMPTNQPLVLLKERDGERILPIWIGVSEAVAIALKLQDVETPRPMTHDLLKSILDDLDVRVDRIVIDDLKDGTFYATIHMHDKAPHQVSSRPSDAIALAVREESPVYAEESVLDEAGIVMESVEDEMERFHEFIDKVEPEDFQA